MMVGVRELIDKQRAHAEALGFDIEELLMRGAGPIYGFRKETVGKPVVYVSSGVHGDEPSGPLAIAELLEEKFFGEQASWIICPLLNPDGLHAGTRETGSGVDLNRDYFQCETQEAMAHAMWLKVQDIPDLFISLHEDWESTGIYMYEINTVETPSHAKKILEAARPYFDIEPEALIDDHEVREPGWIYHSSEPDIIEGWPEAIFVAKNGCPLSYTIETPSSTDLRQRIDCHKATVRCAVEAAFVSATAK